MRTAKRAAAAAAGTYAYEAAYEAAYDVIGGAAKVAAAYEHAAAPASEFPEAEKARLLTAIRLCRSPRGTTLSAAAAFESTVAGMGPGR